MERPDKTTRGWIDDKFNDVFRDPVRDPMRHMLEITWFRNLLYYAGEQWLDWYSQSASFGYRYPLGSKIPTPVSNIIKDYVRSMKALTLNKRYILRVWPNSEEFKDKEAADLGEGLLRWLDSLNDYEIEEVKEDIEFWRQLTGNGFGRVVGDADGRVFLFDSGGKRIKKGDVIVDSILPFNVFMGTVGRKLEDKPEIGIKSLRLKEWVEDTYGKKVEGAVNPLDIEFEQHLLTMIANVSPWKGRGFEDVAFEEKRDELCVLKEMEFAPCKDFPNGRYVVMANDTIVEDRPSLPIPKRKDGSWEYSLVHFPYNLSGGFWASSGVDDLISPQNTINEVDQALAINRKSLGRPIVLTPSELIMKRRSTKGMGILHLQYDARSAGGAKPLIEHGVPYPKQILEERALHRESAQEASGDPKNVLRGQSPHSGASGILVDILREAAEQGHSPDIARFYRGWGKIQRKRLTLAQEFYTETRMVKIKGPGSKIKVKAFKGADLRNNTDVRLELDSGLASTNAGRNDLLTRLIQAGLFGDVTMKPRLQRELVQRMGLGSLPDEENTHRDKACWENAAFATNHEDSLKKIETPGVPAFTEEGEIVEGEWILEPTKDMTFRMDNHVIHLEEHDAFILSREFREMDPEQQVLAISHRDLHEGMLELLQQKQTEMLAEEAEMGIQETGGGPVARPTGATPRGLMGQGALSPEEGGAV